MTDYIDRQAAIDALHTRFRDGFDGDKWWNSTHVLAAIESLPSAEVEPVKRGKWIDIREESDGTGNRIYECSECHHSDIHYPSVSVPYCWHCGARMEKKEE